MSILAPRPCASACMIVNTNKHERSRALMKRYQGMDERGFLHLQVQTVTKQPAQLRVCRSHSQPPELDSCLWVAGAKLGPAKTACSPSEAQNQCKYTYEGQLQQTVGLLCVNPFSACCNDPSFRLISVYDLARLGRANPNTSPSPFLQDKDLPICPGSRS